MHEYFICKSNPVGKILLDYGNVESKPFSRVSHRRLTLLVPDAATTLLPLTIYPFKVFEGYFNFGQYPQDGYYAEEIEKNGGIYDAPIGHRIRFARITANLTLDELAEKAGLDRKTIMRLENYLRVDKNTRPSIDTVRRIALACNREETFCFDEYHYSATSDMLGQEIERYRLQYNLSQADMARLVDVYSFGIRRLEKGPHPLTRKTYQKIKEVLSAPPELDDYQLFISTDYGQAIKEFRLDHGLTQDEFADAMNISLTALRLWEQNKSAPTKDSYTKLKEAFNGEKEVPKNHYPPKDFGLYITKYRQDKGLTKKEFATLAGVNKAILYDWELHGFKPKVKVFRRVVSNIPEILEYIEKGCKV